VATSLKSTAAKAKSSYNVEAFYLKIEFSSPWRNGSGWWRFLQHG